ncbi:hypothetical protein GLW20_01440 [Virgibacillus halodenitrificans]|nr:hypothetical protein [Virgibacillus halodenitrificans]
MQQQWKITAQTGYTFEFEHRLIKNVFVQLVAENEDKAWRKLSQAMGGKQ